MTASAEDRRWMALALTLGRRGMGRVWPNPAVGCVIVSGGRVVGRGWTQAGGRPHAETEALAQAGPAATGATAYVTLEPCSHHGKTPPCADALIAAGIARVVVALNDPDPRVDGSGNARLRAAGLTVTEGVLAEAARADHAGFLLRLSAGRPFVTLKLASSVDGRIATATGESRWITGAHARHRVHGLRLRHDAVMIGGATARQDDPMLTVRGMGVPSQPARVVLTRRLDLPRGGQLAQTARDVPLWLCHGDDAASEDIAFWQTRGAEMIVCPTGPSGQLDPAGALTALATRGLTRIFCEGGGALAASLLAADLVDQLITFTAGAVIGAEGKPSIGAMGLEVLADAPRFALHDVVAVGGDTMHIWRRA
ncbi:MAG: bifunctional diaminohydroxyphosphoribosylaminopyrimidine deaminase/5-amino-6-(5-phosphoribosylamino)uracil reductase RibD [Pseudomonadota bacterium]